MSEIVVNATVVVAAPSLEALKTLEKELCDERNALWEKENAVSARLDEVDQQIARANDAELAKERAVQLQKDGFLMAFEEPHDRFFEHLAALVPGIETHVARLHVTIDGWHLMGSEGVEEDSRDMDIGTLRMSGVHIPKELRRIVNSQMLLAFIEQDGVLRDLNQSSLMQTLTYTDDEDYTGQWTGDVPVYVVVVKPNSTAETNATPPTSNGAKRAKKQK